MADEQKETAMEDYLARISSAMGVEVDKIIDPEEKAKGDEAATAETPEQKADRERKEQEAKAEADKKKSEVVQPLRPVVLREVQKQPEQPSAEEVEKKKQQKADEDYIKSLTPEQQEEIELATFAETIKVDGMSRSQLIEFYRKTDKWVEEHPDADPESDEFKEFVKSNKPKINDSTRRKVEREMIAYNAEARALAKAEEKFKPVVDELNQMKLAPVLAQVNDTISSKLSAKVEGGESIDEDVAKKILTMNPSEAIKAYPVEAPVVVGTAVVMREWAKICNTGDVNLDNKNHAWLMGFIADQESKILELPQDQQVRDGRRFVRMAEYFNLQATNPKLAEKAWTFDEGDISDRIAKLGLHQYNTNLKKLEENGFKRTKPEKKVDPPKVDAAKEAGSGGSPIATGRTALGAGSQANNNQATDIPAHLRSIPGF